MDPARTLSLIDATSMLHRAWYGAFRGGEGPEAPEQARQAGGAAFAAVLGRMLADVRPAFAVAVFDGGGLTVRHQLFPAYKAHRKPPPPGLAVLADHGPEVARALGLKVARTPGVEADDLLAAATQRGRRAGLEVVIVSPDKDVLQLVGEGVYRADPADFALEDADGVEARVGVRPDQIVDWLALTGDSSDGIPGAKGVGAKTAMGLLAHMGTLDAIFADPEDAGGAPVRGAASAVRKIVEQRDQVLLSRELVRLRPDVAVPDLDGVTLGDLRPRAPLPSAVDAGVDLALIAKLTALRRG
ncbi:MAG: exodeoxyribonuclease IX [Deltaproteobacteria bacterium]|nr:MAG: exodeoxyribonuclease IX [Deltaproteobacteria bacterium]